MKLTMSEKERLFVLLNFITTKYADYDIDLFNDEYNRTVFWNILKKLRMELKGF